MRTRKVLQRRAFSQAVAKHSPSRFLLPHPPSPRRYPHQQAPEGGISRGRSAVIGFQTNLKSKVAAAAAARAHSPFLGMRARLSVRGEPELPPPPSPSLAASGALAPARRAGRKERGKEAEKKAGGRAGTDSRGLRSRKCAPTQGWVVEAECPAVEGRGNPGGSGQSGWLSRAHFSTMGLNGTRIKCCQMLTVHARRFKDSAVEDLHVPLRGLSLGSGRRRCS